MNEISDRNQFKTHTARNDSSLRSFMPHWLWYIFIQAAQLLFEIRNDFPSQTANVPPLSLKRSSIELASNALRARRYHRRNYCCNPVEVLTATNTCEATHITQRQVITLCIFLIIHHIKTVSNRSSKDCDLLFGLYLSSLCFSTTTFPGLALSSKRSG
jgi:hypothetical protein